MPYYQLGDRPSSGWSAAAPASSPQPGAVNSRSPWHDAGRGAGKRLSQDDCRRVAADLWRGVDAAGRIAARAGRTANPDLQHVVTLPRYPERSARCSAPSAERHARYSKPFSRRALDRRIRQTGTSKRNGRGCKPIRPITRGAGAALSANPDRPRRAVTPVQPRHARKRAAKRRPWGIRGCWFYEPAAAAQATGKGQQGNVRFHGVGCASFGKRWLSK